MSKVIMVVDDSRTIRTFVMLALRAQGYRVVPAEDGQDALEKLAKEPIDLLITDLNMPNMDGFELIRSFRTQESYRDVPVIILSSLSGQKDIDTGKAVGANTYLVKPFDQERIQTEVARFLV